MTHRRGGLPCLSWVRAFQAGGWRARCWCGGQSRLLTLGPDPDRLPYCGVRPSVQKTEVSNREQGTSGYSAGLKRELRPAQR